MKKALITIGFAVLLVGGRTLAKEFYSDGSIVGGEYWSSADIYDTPPNHTTVNMTGGEVFSMHTHDASILNMTGGIIDNLYSYESSTVNISGNDHSNPFNISAMNNSIINFSGTAQGEEMYAENSATINITGGTIDDLTAYNSGVINIYAGDILDVWAQDNTAVNVFGHNLIKSLTGGQFGYGFVQGIYNNQSSFDIDFRGSDTYSHVNLIPEPATILLFGTGGLIFRKRIS